jgi:hypothetical protein
MGYCCRIFTPVQPVYPAASVRDFLSGALTEARYFDTFTSPQAAFDNLKYCLYHVAGLLSA